jgi:hypothetical protein
MDSQPAVTCQDHSITVRIPYLSRTKQKLTLIRWMVVCIHPLTTDSMSRIDSRGDFGGPVQKGIVSYSVSSNAQVCLPNGLAEYPRHPTSFWNKD